MRKREEHVGLGAKQRFALRREDAEETVAVAKDASCEEEMAATKDVFAINAPLHSI